MSNEEEREAHRLQLHLAQIAAAGDGHYSHLCVIAGKVCGLGRQVFTTSLMVGMAADELGLPYERRYCYENRQDALDALRAWDGVDHPSGPWVKMKSAIWGELLGPGAMTK